MAQGEQIWSEISDDAPSGKSPLIKCIFGLQNGILRLSRVPKGLDLLKKLPFESPKKGPEGPEMGQ